MILTRFIIKNCLLVFNFLYFFIIFQFDNSFEDKKHLKILISCFKIGIKIIKIMI